MSRLGAGPAPGVPGFYDPRFNLYVLKWGAHQLSQGLPGLWDAPFFFPTRGALALSDHLIGPAAAFLFLREAGVPAPAAYNLLLLSTFVLGGGTAWWVLRRSGLSWGAAFLGGWAFAYSSFRWEEIGHYQTLRMQWIPPLLWTFDRLLAAPSARRALAFLACYGLHLAGGAYLAALVHVPMAVLALNRFSPAGLGERRRWLVWLPTAAAGAALVGLFLGPYVEHGIPARPASELRRWSMGLAGYVHPSGMSVLSPAASPWPSAVQGSLYPGVAVLLLAAVALRAGARRFLRPAPPPTATSRLFALGLGTAGLGALATGLLLADRFTERGEGDGYLVPLALALSGGLASWAALRLWRGGSAVRWEDVPAWPRGLLLSGALCLALCLPVFFWGMQQSLPGFEAMRVSSRAYAFVALPLSFLVGSGWDRLAARTGRGAPRRAVLALLAVSLVLESLPRRSCLAPQPLPDEADFPAYAHWIARTDGVSAYYELPAPSAPHGELVAMYFGSLHWKPLVNGFSSSIPQATQDIARRCTPLPDPGCLDRLEALGVTHLVLHWEGLPWHPEPRVRRRPAAQRARFERDVAAWGGRVDFKDGSTVAYSLRRAPIAGIPAS